MRLDDKPNRTKASQQMVALEGHLNKLPELLDDLAVLLTKAPEVLELEKHMKVARAHFIRTQQGGDKAAVLLAGVQLVCKMLTGWDATYGYFVLSRREVTKGLDQLQALNPVDSAQKGLQERVTNIHRTDYEIKMLARARVSAQQLKGHLQTIEEKLAEAKQHGKDIGVLCHSLLLDVQDAGFDAHQLHTKISALLEHLTLKDPQRDVPDQYQATQVTKELPTDSKQSSGEHKTTAVTSGVIKKRQASVRKSGSHGGLSRGSPALMTTPPGQREVSMVTQSIDLKNNVEGGSSSLSRD